MCAAVAVLTGCRKSDSRPVLVASVEPQAELLREIAGPSFQVITLLNNGADAESFEPTIRTRTAVDDADLVFITGLLPFEETVVGGVDKSKLIDNSQSINLIYGTHGHSHHHGDEDSHHHDGGADPHIWASVRNARIMAADMQKALTKAYPDSAAAFEARFRRLDARLDSLDRIFADRLTDVTFAIWHPSLTYFARDYGMEQLAVGFENKEMSARRISEAVEHAKLHKPRVFIEEAGRDSRQSRQFAETLGIPALPVNIMSADFIEQLDSLSHALER